MLDRADAKAVQREAFRADVLAGLSQTPKRLPARWLYDDRGSELFEEITRVDDYYPTRTETGILEGNAAAMAGFCGTGAVIIEYGAGAGVKTEILLGALEDPALYVPVDIAGDFLKASAERIESRFPDLTVQPVVADFTDDFDLPEDLPRGARRVGFFPGSTIGNLDADEAADFLKRMRGHVQAGGRAILGTDLKKDVATLVRAYDDSEGVTAEFDRNILKRINRELGGTFPVDRFVHEARWNETASAVEMHLKSLDAQTVEVAGRPFRFAPGETIHTESSRKYSVEGFSRLASACGWAVEAVWTDRGRKFAVLGLVAQA
ncbi:L-histidine N(alpha)-methyltransferase [Aurantimonas sp. VKM B-3413]|uniref:L-histidine N(alpha)-methyltransferase n=1 Tax=Aurantimonas sp. VKM B-3413 TaxID=2779401 RepID=UPI001E52DCFD|nr:L-histidine N(alpha)-methyltransferase [Aurantimonas sp. VKM B-3413]MCB8839536.1 L-histidine N(alpha)-methyltransferase [Aurantimonas sp. VKM B-3413]